VLRIPAIIHIFEPSVRALTCFSASVSFGCPTIRLLIPCSTRLTPTCPTPEFMTFSFVKNRNRPACVVWAEKVSNRLLVRVGLSCTPIADRRPIDPPPIVQLRVLDPALQSANAAGSSQRDNHAGSDSDSPDPRAFSDDVADASTFSQSFLQNPYYFMFACLARPDDDAELHWLKVCILRHQSFIWR
jgi:hypothetical protein